MDMWSVEVSKSRIQLVHIMSSGTTLWWIPWPGGSLCLTTPSLPWWIPWPGGSHCLTTPNFSSKWAITSTIRTSLNWGLYLKPPNVHNREYTWLCVRFLYESIKSWSLEEYMMCT
jgi:hypothetical protein